ncbi:MAG: ABC transporter permease subunit [Oscillospiraceae bacterium]|nr:ABC transporter permease subunit [Oscillospiraceae bacterium]
MGAIFRREITSYFTSPVGYVFLAVFYFCAGIFFWAGCLQALTADMSACFALMFYVNLIFVPLITMKLLSDDKRLRTDQALLTSPVSLAGIVYGKFFAALVLYVAAVAIFPVFGMILSLFGEVPWSTTFGTVIGLFFLGAAFISIGIFVSSLTENVVVAAVLAIVFNLVFLIMDTISDLIAKISIDNVDWLNKVFEAIANGIKNLSFYDKYNEFTTGVFNVSSILFYLSIVAVFNFLTIRVLEKRRWS